ncbi:MAG TPA: hypothetical protein VE958_02490 [Bryobacteraceae bacterium]|jgi:hypothetical protein|nr:hypothetical protein [Bryobacteraceae bacterium]
MRSILILVIAGLLQAQDKPAESKPEPREAAIIPVKTLTGDSFDRLVRLLNVFNAQAQYSGDKNLRSIVVYAPKDVIEQMRKVVNELDRPGSEAAIGRNIDMTMTFLKCSVKAPAGGAAALPNDLESVAKQLRAATQYKYMEVWDVVPLRLQEGKVTEQSLRLPGPTLPNGLFPTANIRIHPESVTHKDLGRYVRFEQVKIGFRVPMSTGQFIDFGLTTSGDFMEGQKTVLGKVSGTDEDAAIFVVIALKVLD